MKRAVVTHIYSDRNRGDAAITLATIQQLEERNYSVDLLSQYSFKDQRFHHDHRQFHQKGYSPHPALFPEPDIRRHSDFKKGNPIKKMVMFCYFLLKNVRRDGEGNFNWRINLQALKDNLVKIMDGLDTDRMVAEGGITGFPVLFISGANSDYIRTEDHQLIRSIFPVAEFVTIPNAGHWVHAEQPALLVKNIKYFLDI